MFSYTFDKATETRLERVRKALEGRRVILASASPRRRELLAYMCSNFEVIPADIDETLPDSVPAGEAARYLAEQKCAAVADMYKDALVIGSDTVVLLDDTILGKPENEAAAADMLSKLSGRSHSVVSGIAVSVNGKMKSASDETPVAFSPLSDKFIQDYVATGSPLDKAGAYGIQELDESIARIESGSLTNVVGLPVERLSALIEQMLISEGE